MPEKLRLFRFGRFVFYVMSRDGRYGNEDAMTAMVFRPLDTYRTRNDWPMPRKPLERSQYGEWKAQNLTDLLCILKNTPSWDVIRTEMLSRRQVITRKLTAEERKEKLTELADAMKTAVKTVKYTPPTKTKEDKIRSLEEDAPKWEPDPDDTPDWLKERS